MGRKRAREPSHQSDSPEGTRRGRGEPAGQSVEKKKKEKKDGSALVRE
jgi:hypothetical protein